MNGKSKESVRIFLCTPPFYFPAKLRDCQFAGAWFRPASYFAFRFGGIKTISVSGPARLKAAKDSESH